MLTIKEINRNCDNVRSGYSMTDLDFVEDQAKAYVSLVAFLEGLDADKTHFKYPEYSISEMDCTNSELAKSITLDLIKTFIKESQ